VFEYKELRNISESKRGEIIEGRTQLHNEELHNLYSSPNIIGVSESRSMWWTSLVACMGEEYI
jgi:hypothetical protein